MSLPLCLLIKVSQKPDDDYDVKNDGEDDCDDNYECDEVDDDEEERPKSSSGRRSKTNTKAVKTFHYKSSKPMKKVDEDDTSKLSFHFFLLAISVSYFVIS